VVDHETSCSSRNAAIFDLGMQAAVEGRSYPDIMRAYLDAGA